jgi:hypothetical protein
LPFEAAFAEQTSLPVESVSLSGQADATPLENRGEFLPWIDAKNQECENPSGFAPNRLPHEYGRNGFPEAVLQNDIMKEGKGNSDLVRLQQVGDVKGCDPIDFEVSGSAQDVVVRGD